MRLSIFSRLIIGYMAVFLPVMAVSVYTIFQLRQFNNINRSITDIDNQIIEYGNKLSDSFLSQVQHERKYIIIKDDALYDQFLIAEKDFIQYFEKLASLADTRRNKDLLIEIRDYYSRYISLFNEEIEFVRANKSYSQDWYKQEKEKAVDGIMEGMKKLKIYTEQDTYEKIKRLGETGAKAHSVAMVMIIISMLFGIVVSIFITKSITRPLSVMKKKTRDIAGGDFDENLSISAPPEIKELSQDFNLMCNKLKEMDKMKSDFFSLMAHELRTPSPLLKKEQISFWKA